MLALGCLHHDPDRLAAMPMLDRGALASRAAIGQSFDTSSRSKLPFFPSLGDNDVVGDCTAVAMMNLAAWDYRLKTGADLAVDQKMCLPFYASVVGCAPTIEAAMLTNGAYMIDVINKQTDDGYDMGIPGMSMVVGKLRNVPLTRDTMAEATSQYGGLVLEIGVTPADDLSGNPWQVLPTHQRTNHAVCAGWCSGIQDEDHVAIFTWGNVVRLTWLALECRLNVAWCSEYPWHSYVASDM